MYLRKPGFHFLLLYLQIDTDGSWIDFYFNKKKCVILTSHAGGSSVSIPKITFQISHSN